MQSINSTKYIPATPYYFSLAMKGHHIMSLSGSEKCGICFDISTNAISPGFFHRTLLRELRAVAQAYRSVYVLKAAVLFTVSGHIQYSTLSKSFGNVFT